MNLASRVRVFAMVACVTAALPTVTACVARARPRAGVVYVREGPPQPVVEVISVAPSRAHVWIPGYHVWRGNSYVWVAGHYEVPGRGFSRYEPGQWKRDRNGWYFVEGRWR